jgi:hypothetical protein
MEQVINYIMRTFLAFTAAALFLVPSAALAQTGDITQDCSGPIPCYQNTLLGQGSDGLSGISAIIVTVANWMFILLLVLAVLWIIIAAYKYLFSGGAEEAVSSAHKMIIYAAIAIAVAMLSKGVVFIVRELVTSGGNVGGYGSGPNGSVNANINLQTKYGNVQINPNIKF